MQLKRGFLNKDPCSWGREWSSSTPNPLHVVYGRLGGESEKGELRARIT